MPERERETESEGERERERTNNSSQIKFPLARKHRSSLSPSPLCRNHSTVSQQRTSAKKKKTSSFFFNFEKKKSTFYRAQVSGGHRYETALDFLFRSNGWSSDISPYPQIILLHPLLAPQSSPLSPQFCDKTLFLECNARCTSVSPVSGPLSFYV